MLSQPGTTLESWEQIRIEECMRTNSSNKTHTARELGITINTLTAKLEIYADKRRQADRDRTKQNELKAEWAKKARFGHAYAGQGVGLESTPQVPSKPQVPMPERSEVQEVLQKQAASRSPKGTRESIRS